LDGIWAIDEHALLEATALIEVIGLIKDMDGDFSE
jgi:hypothetical protein